VSVPIAGAKLGHHVSINAPSTVASVAGHR
jgi:hypothetical protein